MTVLQKEAIDLIPRIPDDKLYYVIQLLKGVCGLSETAEATDSRKAGKRIIGIANGRIYRSEDYDFDAEDPEIIAMFEDAL